VANPTLSAIMWGLALLVSALAVLSFARGLAHMWRTVSAGTPDPGRLAPVGKRAWGVVSAALTHREFKGRPWIKAAHWLVMVSFPILFFTLVTGYAQLRVQTFTLPLLGHFAPWEWLTEAFAWGGLAGIILLMIVRQRAGHGTEFPTAAHRPPGRRQCSRACPGLDDDGCGAPRGDQPVAGEETPFRGPGGGRDL